MTKAFTPNIKSKRGKDLTKYVANFVYKTKFKSIPKEVVELARHILIYTQDNQEELLTPPPPLTPPLAAYSHSSTLGSRMVLLSKLPNHSQYATASA